MKRIRILVFALLLIVFIVLSFLFSRKINQNSSVLVPLSSVPEITAPRIFQNTSTVSFSYTGPQLVLPSTLPSYKVERADLSEELVSAEKLSRALGAANSPKTTIEGVYDWIEGYKQFTYDSRSHRVSFSIADGGNKQLINKERTLSLLKETNVLNESVVIKELSNEFFKGEENKEQAFLSIYGYYIETFPIIFNPVDKTAGSIISLVDGSVSSFSFSFSPSTLNKRDERQLMNVEETVTAANQQKGFLSSVKSSEKEYPYRVTPSFSSFQISNIQIVYLLVEEEDTLVPMYVLSGRGNNNQEVQYFLRASS